MRKLCVLALALALFGCSRPAAVDDVAAGSEVTVQKKDGVAVEGRLIEATAEQVVVEAKDGVKTSVPRSQILSLKPAAPAAAERADAQAGATATPAAATSGEAPAAPAAPVAPAAPRPIEEKRAKTAEFREVTLPAGTVLPLTLATAIASDTSHVEDAVRATIRSAVSADGIQALPAGTEVLGHVTNAEEAGRVKGRASIGVRFNTIDLPGNGGRETIQTAAFTRVAAATKKKDAAKIGVGAGAGAVIGGIIGGGGGAAKGAAIGGGAGTAAVLATRGEEVRLAAGTPISVKLTAPLTVRVPLR